jgi:sirohydrochlorin ferrochelatase
MSDTDKTTGRGKIGEQIFAQVEALVGAEHITRTEAFQRIAVERGSRAGTVAANYYRIARLRNDGTVRPRGRKKAPTSDADAVIARATTALNELTSLVRQQSRELERLSEKVQQIDKLRALLAD